MIEQFMEKVAKRRVGKETLKHLDDADNLRKASELINGKKHRIISFMLDSERGAQEGLARKTISTGARGSLNARPKEISKTLKGDPVGHSRKFKVDYGTPYKVSPERAARQDRIKKLTGKYSK